MNAFNIVRILKKKLFYFYFYYYFSFPNNLLILYKEISLL